MKERVIFFGAGQYPKNNFNTLREKYEPLCFCDRKAKPNDELFGVPVLPPSALKEIYPNTPILVTMDKNNKYAVFSWLVEIFGISEDRILEYTPVMKDISCHLLDSHAVLILNNNNKYEWMFCCNEGCRNVPPHINFDINDSACSIVTTMQEYRKSIKVSLIKHEKCKCTGCIMLEEKYVPLASHPLNVSPLKGVTLIPKITCNARCIYCNEYLNKTSQIDIFKFKAILKEMEIKGLLDMNTHFTLGSGEITLHPQRKNIISAIKNYNRTILSNCLIYDESIISCNNPKNRQIINCSLDSGTQATYNKVKGIDKFDTVICNIKQYAKNANIELKYIILPGMNDNEKDIVGFIEIAKNTNASSIILSRNHHNMTPLNDYTITIIRNLLKEAQNNGIKIDIISNHFSAVEMQAILKDENE